MPTLSAGQLTEELHETNRRMRLHLDRLLSSGSHGAGFDGAGPAPTPTPEQMTGMLSELMRAGEWLRSRPAEPDAALARELAEYREQVERLRALLPAMHASLLRERARIEQQRDRVQSAAEWARASRQTF